MKNRHKRHNVIWLEFERCPSSVKNEQTAIAANKLFRKLGLDNTLQWSESGNVYELIFPGQAFITLEDDGHFFNLDYINK